MIDLTGKSAIVTGSGRGIGRAIAVKLAELGAAVTICDISEEIASATVSELRQRGLEADYFVLDVADADAARALIEKTAEKRGKLDILVNNAGINRDAMLHKMERKQWDEVIAVNLTGTYNTMQPASIQMREQKKAVASSIFPRPAGWAISGRRTMPPPKQG